jgi:hypothetical protein
LYKAMAPMAQNIAETTTGDWQHNMLQIDHVNFCQPCYFFSSSFCEYDIIQPSTP